MTERIISQETLDEIERVSNEWPDGVHTCAELQVLEPGRRPCSCGRCYSEVRGETYGPQGRGAVPNESYSEPCGCRWVWVTRKWWQVVWCPQNHRQADEIVWEGPSRGV